MSWQTEVRHLRERVRTVTTLTEVDLDTLDEALRQAEVCRETLEKLVQGCQYARTSARAGGTEFHYEGATVLTEEQMALVNQLKGLYP